MSYSLTPSMKGFTAACVSTFSRWFSKALLATTNVAAISITWTNAAITAQAADRPAAPQRRSDVLIFSNDDKLTGRFEHSAGKSLTFKSDMAGEITIDWSEVKELQTSGEYAVISKDAELNRREDMKTIPQGNVSVREQQRISISGTEESAPRTVATEEAAYVVDQNTFNSAIIRSPGILRSSSGTITAGTSLVNGTQQSTAFNGAGGFSGRFRMKHGSIRTIARRSISASPMAS